MLCEHCKKRTATVFYNEKLNGRSRSLSLCGECAAKLRESGEIRDVTSMIGSFADPFSTLLDGQFGDFFGLLLPTEEKKDRTCPACGRSLGSILAEGKLGCGECYSAFRKELSPLLTSLHGVTAHRGCVPSRQLAKRARAEQLRSLREALRTALCAEDYEKAASLRDEIRALDGGRESERNGMV